MRVLLLGAGGQVGRAVVSANPYPSRLLALTRAELDLADTGSVERVLTETQPDWIVNAAAFTAVDLAEQRTEEARALNDRAVGHLVRVAGQIKARLLHLSTDFVFDGESSRPYRPGDVPRPLSVYGTTKLAGEVHVLTGAARGVVVRTAWVYASVGRNFVLTMLKLMAERDEVRVVSDQIGTPTWAGGLGRLIWDLIEADVEQGIYHWTDLGVASWYDFAVAIREEAFTRGLLARETPVIPITTAEYPVVARRPAFSVLDSVATRRRVATRPAHWRQNLRIMLDELRAT